MDPSIDIPHLEFMAAALGCVVFAPALAGAAMVCLGLPCARGGALGTALGTRWGGRNGAGSHLTNYW